MGLLEVAVLLAWLAILLCLWLVYQLVAQHGRLLLRLEALERRLSDLGGLSSARDSNETAREPGSDEAFELVDEEEHVGPPGIPPGTVLHDFELPDLAGRQHLRSDWLGQRLLMTFVSPSCRHSQALLADLAAVRATPAPTWPLPVLVSTGSTEENRRLVERSGLTETVLVQEEMEVGALFEVAATPTAYLVDEDGRTASPLVAGRAAVLGLAASAWSGDAAPRVETPSADLFDAETTPAPVNGERYLVGLEVGSRAPGFELPGVDGRTVGLDQLRGKPALLVFTDPTHPPCGEVAVRLEAVHRLGSGPSTVVIARGDLETNRAWAAEHGLTPPIGLQHRWDVSRAYGLLATPVAYLVDERGNVAAPVAVGADAILDLAASAAGAGR